MKYWLCFLPSLFSLVATSEMGIEEFNPLWKWVSSQLVTCWLSHTCLFMSQSQTFWAWTCSFFDSPRVVENYLVPWNKNHTHGSFQCRYPRVPYLLLRRTSLFQCFLIPYSSFSFSFLLSTHPNLPNCDIHEPIRFMWKITLSSESSDQLEASHSVSFFRSIFASVFSSCLVYTSILEVTIFSIFLQMSLSHQRQILCLIQLVYSASSTQTDK